MRNILVILSFIFLFSGCVNKINHPNFVIEDDEIYDSLEFINVNEKDRKDGLKEIRAIFKNYTNDDTKIAYRIDWFDENGFLIDSIMSKWKISQVEGRRDLIIYGISPSTKAKNFKIKMQLPTKNDENLNNVAIYEFNKN